MIGNIKETFPPKTGMREKQLLQDPGYVRGCRGISHTPIATKAKLSSRQTGSLINIHEPLI